MSLIYQHNKLVQINKNNSIYPIRYEYNEQGLRTKKFTPSVDKEYYYIRDILLNILGIVDNQGTLVVKYDYNAWGKSINGTNNNGIILDTTSNNIGSD